MRVCTLKMFRLKVHPYRNKQTNNRNKQTIETIRVAAQQICSCFGHLRPDLNSNQKIKKNTKRFTHTGGKKRKNRIRLREALVLPVLFTNASDSKLLLIKILPLEASAHSYAQNSQPEGLVCWQTILLLGLSQSYPCAITVC